MKWKTCSEHLPQRSAQPSWEQIQFSEEFQMDWSFQSWKPLREFSWFKSVLLIQAHILQWLLSSVKHQDRMGDPGSFLCCLWKPGARRLWLNGTHWTYGFGEGTFMKTAMRSLIKWASQAECCMTLLRSVLLAQSLLCSFVDVFQIGVRL